MANLTLNLIADQAKSIDELVADAFAMSQKLHLNIQFKYRGIMVDIDEESNVDDVIYHFNDKVKHLIYLSKLRDGTMD